MGAKDAEGKVQGNNMSDHSLNESTVEYLITYSVGSGPPVMHYEMYTV